MQNKILAFGAMALCGVLGSAAMQTVARAADAVADTGERETLDLSEVKIAAGAHFDKLNKDGDPTLEANEVKGVMSSMMFKGADLDQDGSISKDEYLAFVEKLFNEADVDHDGSLTVMELKSRSGKQLKKLID